MADQTLQFDDRFKAVQQAVKAGGKLTPNIKMTIEEGKSIVEALINDKKSVEDELRVLIADREAAKKQLDEISKEKSQLAEGNKLGREELASLNAQISHMREDNDGLVIENKKLKTDKEELLLACSNLEKKKMDLETLLQNMRSNLTSTPVKGPAALHTMETPIRRHPSRRVENKDDEAGKLISTQTQRALFADGSQFSSQTDRDLFGDDIVPGDEHPPSDSEDEHAPGGHLSPIPEVTEPSSGQSEATTGVKVILPTDESFGSVQPEGNVSVNIIVPKEKVHVTVHRDDDLNSTCDSTMHDITIPLGGRKSKRKNQSKEPKNQEKGKKIEPQAHEEKSVTYQIPIVVREVTNREMTQIDLQRLLDEPAPDIITTGTEALEDPVQSSVIPEGLQEPEVGRGKEEISEKLNEEKSLPGRHSQMISACLSGFFTSSHF